MGVHPDDILKNYDLMVGLRIGMAPQRSADAYQSKAAAEESMRHVDAQYRDL